MDKLLEVKNLTVQYDGGGYAIENINIDVNDQEIIGIVGESGSGKTTLVRAIINLLSSNAKIVSGEVVFCGENIGKYNKEQWRKLRGNEIAMIFQNPGSYLNPIMKIGKQFIESIRSHRDISKAQAVKKAKDTLEKMGLDDGDRMMNSYPYQLSGGMKQRVAIAMAMAMEPKLILADEPTSALDVITQTQIANELLDLRDKFKTSIVMITHNIGFAAYIADRIVVMHDGKVVECDNKSQIILEPKAEYTRTLLQTIPELKGF
ncbi:ABC transporter ATP-binding protein [Clostridium formicaceticum]|uniref:Oligopeptide transport ATP-binding protein OppD n=1 Tax=Clostridium formicaceticum TaxID=1497 RepID=A0AAC9RNB2_9CLOT|nr:ABC transporter ATP-binding protein [Clostridium formicaceticum]AOY74491.1 peptide ABC transporter ATP-binding protein [Clostridium formicaceticum]ARE88839.1 Oligopeptide transport ATP-binding protein OppD [Clostridium formicaceticum]